MRSPKSQSLKRFQTWDWRLIRSLQIDSLRAEITLFEAAKAYAAMDGRQEVCADDLRVVTPMAVRMRRSVFMNQYFADRIKEEEEITQTINNTNQQS